MSKAIATWLPLVAALPLLVAAVLTLVDRDFAYTLPLTALLTLGTVGLSFLRDPAGNWRLRGLIAGSAGFVVMLALLMSIEV